MRAYYNNLRKNKIRNNQIKIDTVTPNSIIIKNNHESITENKNTLSSLAINDEKLNSSKNRNLNDNSQNIIYNNNISLSKYNNSNLSGNPILNKNFVNKTDNYYESTNKNNYSEIHKCNQENSKNITYSLAYHNNRKQKNDNNKIDYNNDEEDVNEYIIVLPKKTIKIKNILNKIIQIIYCNFLKIYYPIFHRNISFEQKDEKNKKGFEILQELLIKNNIKNMKIIFQLYKQKVDITKNKIELIGKLFKIYKNNKYNHIRKYLFKWKNKFERKIEIKNFKLKNSNSKILISLSKRKCNSPDGKSYIKIKAVKKKKYGCKNIFSSFTELSDQSSDQKSIGNNTQVNGSPKKFPKKKMKMIYIRTHRSNSNNQNKISEEKKEPNFSEKIRRIIMKTDNKNTMFKYFKQWKNTKF